MPWVKGQSGNPSGSRPESIEVKEVRRLAQSATPEAYATIESLMRGAEKDTVRLTAALAILKIAGLRFDSPPESVDVTPNLPPPTYSREALMAAARGNA